MLPAAQAKIDISSFSPEEKELFERYGRVPGHKSLLANKLKERRFFDSGDYALKKAGVAPQIAVGTAIPSPADIPHASSCSTSPVSFGSPTSSFSSLGTSPGKESLGREDNMTFQG